MTGLWAEPAYILLYRLESALDRSDLERGLMIPAPLLSWVRFLLKHTSNYTESISNHS